MFWSSSSSVISGSVISAWMFSTAAFNCCARSAPSMGLTVVSCLPYCVLSVVISPSTISGCCAKYWLMGYPSGVVPRSTHSARSTAARSRFCRNKMSATTLMFALRWNALFGRRIAPTRSARLARYSRTEESFLSIVPLEVTTATTPPGRTRSRLFAIK